MKQLDFLSNLSNPDSKDTIHIKKLLSDIRNFKLLKSKIIMTLGNFNGTCPQYTPLLDARGACDRVIDYLFMILGGYAYKQKKFRGKTITEIRYELDEDYPILGDPTTPVDLINSLRNILSGSGLSDTIGHFWNEPITSSILNLADKYEDEIDELYAALFDYRTANHEKNRK